MRMTCPFRKLELDEMWLSAAKTRTPTPNRALIAVSESPDWMT
jgi:hypothetical protein